MTTVLVTGGAGYIGSHAVLALRDAGRAVVVIDDLSTGSRDAVPSGVPFYAGSVADGGLLNKIAGAHEVGAILHFAGSAVAPASVAAPLDYYRNNTVASQGLIEHVVRHRVRHLVFSSSAAVYGVTGGEPISEDSPCRPANPYGRSKLMTEIMLADAAAAHPLNYAALRYFNVAGADPAGRAGQIGTAATHLIKVAVEAAIGKRPGVHIHGADYTTPDGTGVRDYIHVSDLAAVHILALDRLISRPHESLTLNCGYGRGTSVLEVLDAVDAVAGVSLQRSFGPRRHGDADMVVADTSRLQEILGWRPCFGDLTTIIAHALAWERNDARYSTISMA